jgi:hypothetical protein
LLGARVAKRFNKKCPFKKAAKKAKKLRINFRQEAAKNTVISLDYFIISKSHHELPKVANGQNIAQSGHPARSKHSNTV